MNNENKDLTTPQQPEKSADSAEPATTEPNAGQENTQPETTQQAAQPEPQGEAAPGEQVPEQAEPAAPEEAPAEPVTDAAQRLEQMDAAAAQTAVPPESVASPEEGSPQPFPQQPYAAYQTPEVASADGEAAARKSNKTLLIAVGVVLAVVALLIAAFAIGFGGGGASGNDPLSLPSRTNDPEGYLAAVVHNTTIEVLEGETVLNLARFEGMPVAHDFSISIDLSMLDDSYMVPKIGIDGSLKVDRGNQKALFDMAITSSFISFSGNQLYISPDVIALAIPTVVSRYDYVTINPDTFVEDYEDSMFYSPYSTQIPSDYDLRKQLENMFDSTDVENPVVDDFVERTSKRLEQFQATAQFKDEGTFTETINGKSVEVYKMSYTYSAQEVEWLYEDFVDEFEAFMEEQTELVNMSGSMAYYSSDFDELFEALDAISFTTDVTVRYTINQNDQVIRVEAEKIGIELDTGYSYTDDEFQIGYVLELLGEEKVGDNIRLGVSIYSYDYDETVELVLSFENRDEGNMVGRRYAVELIDDDDDFFALQADFEWRPDEDGKNMRLTLEGYDEVDAAGVRITGHMDNNKDEFSITNGSIMFYVGDYDAYELEFEYKLYEIAASEVEIKLDEANTILFSDLRERDFVLF